MDTYGKDSNFRYNKKFNKYYFDNDVGHGVLKNGDEFLFDKEDFELIRYIYWQSEYRNGTPKRIRGNARTGNSRYVSIHRLVSNCPNGLQVDHINRNVFDNRKENLRIVTNKENSRNRGISKINTSEVKGVCFDNKSDKWVVQCKYEDIRIYKYFDTKKDAIVCKEVIDMLKPQIVSNIV